MAEFVLSLACYVSSTHLKRADGVTDSFALLIFQLCFDKLSNKLQRKEDEILLQSNRLLHPESVGEEAELSVF
ncbi:MAG: hypothetical protein M3367_17140 [Acidobacteriota bacterium]|nr:hypothetical protein [Acidobacteriota bacterium]